MGVITFLRLGLCSEDSVQEKVQHNQVVTVSDYAGAKR